MPARLLLNDATNPFGMVAFFVFGGAAMVGRKEDLIKARVTPGFHVALKAAAKSRGQSASDFMREAIRERISADAGPHSLAEGA